jgi:exonuclease III
VSKSDGKEDRRNDVAKLFCKYRSSPVNHDCTYISQTWFSTDALIVATQVFCFQLSICNTHTRSCIAYTCHTFQQRLWLQYNDPDFVYISSFLTVHYILKGFIFTLNVLIVKRNNKNVITVTLNKNSTQLSYSLSRFVTLLMSSYLFSCYDDQHDERDVPVARNGDANNAFLTGQKLHTTSQFDHLFSLFAFSPGYSWYDDLTLHNGQLNVYPKIGFYLLINKKYTCGLKINDLFLCFCYKNDYNKQVAEVNTLICLQYFHGFHGYCDESKSNVSYLNQCLTFNNMTLLRSQEDNVNECNNRCDKKERFIGLEHESKLGIYFTVKSNYCVEKTLYFFVSCKSGTLAVTRVFNYMKINLRVMWMIETTTQLTPCTSETLSSSRCTHHRQQNEDKIGNLKKEDLVICCFIKLCFFCDNLICIKNVRLNFCCLHCLQLDSFQFHKGSMLYAAPHSCISDHSVIIISTIKGKAICFAPTNLSNSIDYMDYIDENLLSKSELTKLIISMCSSVTIYAITRNLGYRYCSLNLPRNHLDAIVDSCLMHDIEMNPGPTNKVTLKIVTLNCRGLGEMNKCRLLLNKINRIVSNSPAVVMLQETMIITDNYLKFAWRGKYVHTPGNGNAQGCITLLPHSVEIISTDHYGTRGHCVHIKGLTIDGDSTVAIYNIYAPNGFNREKNQFFENIFENMSAFNGNIILGGDFNTTLRNSDRHNRGVTTAEMRTAGLILDNIEELNLIDSWGNLEGFTWRRGQIMSKLDRILYRLDNYVLKNNTISWTITTSDHAAVIATLEHCEQTRPRNDHIKLDNNIIKNPLFLNEIREYVINQLEDASNMNPHMKLEFAKMSIRTITLAIMKRERKRESLELEDINRDIATNTMLLTRQLAAADLRTITIELEELNGRKAQILQSQGSKLAHLAKSRWYNDGEKSNKYFLNLLKRRSQNNEMSKLMVNGSLETDPGLIRGEVTNFYKKLYNSTETVGPSEQLLRNMFSVTQYENEYVSKPITLDELWLNLRNAKATTPGPDGMSNTYLKKLWHIIGPLILDAWKYSIETGELPPSHKNSILRLIPKQGKDSTHIKNWRPITLSNCDHKLITRTYNARLLHVIGQYITPTQTAYIKGRNISDNLRLINTAVKLAESDNDINGIMIALDAQKAFDSVNHDYIATVLQKCALTSFIPLFKLLYKDLRNDIMINGKIGNGYRISNGVKQGDALSCSLFILAIEPIIRNVINNDNIETLTSDTINYAWPKVLGYADDITILTNNNNRCINAIFDEYGLFTTASGLKLNADKTEIFTIKGGNVPPDPGLYNIGYLDQHYTLNQINTIKINGIYFNTDRLQMQETNLALMKEKMSKHFSDWSKRSLSILGKIQIIKTFGLSQYLYTLAVINLNSKHWKQIRKIIYKFIWNKNMNAAPAPDRIRRELLLTPIDQGGFGMVDLESVMKSSRIKRFAYLMEYNTHPIAEMQRVLCHNNLMNTTPSHNIDDVTTTVLQTLHTHHLASINKAEDHCVETDLNLQRIMLNSKIKHICLKNKLRSAELNTLTRRGVDTLIQALDRADDSITLVRNISNFTIQRHINTLLTLPANTLPRDIINATYMYDGQKKTMVRVVQLNSKCIRQMLNPTKTLNITKRIDTSVENAICIYNKVKQIRSIQSRTKILRLIHGDVYCGARLKKFKLSDNDRCLRCFEEETISHLLLECPYTAEVWRKLGVVPNSLTELLTSVDRINIEILTQLIDALVFRKKVLPTDVLIRTTITAFANGLCRNQRVIGRAKNILNNFQSTGSWSLT